MKGCGVFVVTVTVRVPLFAVTVAPIGMKSPSSGDLFVGIADEVEVLLDHGRSHLRSVRAA